MQQNGLNLLATNRKWVAYFGKIAHGVTIKYTYIELFVFVFSLSLIHLFSVDMTYFLLEGSKK